MDRSTPLLFMLIVLIATFADTFCSIIFKDPYQYEGSTCMLSDGSEGVCSENCSTKPSNVGDLKVCGYRRENVIICCPKGVLHRTIEEVCENRTKTLKLKEEQKLQRRVARRRDREEGTKILFEECVRMTHEMDTLDIEQAEEFCRERVKGRGRDRDNLVPSLFASEVNEHPHMAALGRTNPVSETIDWFCGGILIHEQYVLTAAHCIMNIGLPDVVRVGEVRFDDLDNDEYGKEYFVVDLYIHPNYTPPVHYNDIAILRIEESAEQHSIVSPLPACIFTKNDLPVDTFLIMGYGAPAFGRARNYRLYQGNLTLLSNDICNQSYYSWAELPNGIISSQICAHDPSRIMDTCEGDSGGPLQFSADDEFSTPYIAGVTSFGTLCLDGNPGVYTRVYPYLSWIESIIRKDD